METSDHMPKRPSRDLLDLFSDGELSEQEACLVKECLRTHPEDRDHVAFERKLRRHVGQLMRAQCPSAPPGLEDRIREHLGKRAAGALQTDVLGTIGRPIAPGKAKA